MDSRNALRSTGEAFSHRRLSSAEISVLGVILGGCTGATAGLAAGTGGGAEISFLTGGGGSGVVHPERITISTIVLIQRSPEKALLIRLQLSWFTAKCPP